MTRRDKDALGTHHPPHSKGFVSRVQHALGRLAPKSWGVRAAAAHNSHAAAGGRSSADLELSARQSNSSMGTSDGAAFGVGDPSRPQTGGSISHISSINSLGAATNDATSVASGSSAHATARQHQQHGAHHGPGSSTPADDLCSLATQAGSAAHSFTSLASMVTTAGPTGDASSDGGQSLIPAGPATTAASDRAIGLSASPTAAGSSNLSLLSAAYRSSDAGDATSVSTLPLISEAGFDEGSLARGFDERLIDVQTLGEEQEGRRERSSSDGGGEPEPYNSDGSLLPHQSSKPRISSSHGSHTSLTSSTSEQREPPPPASAQGLGGPLVRMPSPAHGRMSHGQRSSSRHSFQQQLQQQLLQDLEESQEEGSLSASLPVPFSTRRRPDNDDMCSYATQAGSSVHSLSSVMSHLEYNSNQPGQRPQWSSDGNALLPAAAGGGSSSRKGSFSSLTQQQQQQSSAASRSRRSSAETAGSAQHTAVPSTPGAPLQFVGGTSAAASPSMTTTDLDLSEPGDSPRAAELGHADGQTADGFDEDSRQGGVPGSLQRKNSLKGAFKAVTRWGSGISQRLQRTTSSESQHQQQQQHELEREQWLVQQGSLPSSGSTGAGAGGGQELASLRRHVTG